MGYETSPIEKIHKLMFHMVEAHETTIEKALQNLQENGALEKYMTKVIHDAFGNIVVNYSNTMEENKELDTEIKELKKELEDMRSRISGLEYLLVLIGDSYSISRDVSVKRHIKR